MAIIETINSAINTVVWGKPMLVLLVGAGILLTCLLYTSPSPRD